MRQGACVAAAEPAGPYYIAISGAAWDSLAGSSTSVMVASVSSSTLATETAFSSAMRTTLVGSMIPA